MFCKFCGGAIEEDARFCSLCGKPIADSDILVQTSAEPEVKLSDANGEMNREVMLQYFSDVRAVESMLVKIDKEINEKEDEVSRLGMTKIIDKKSLKNQLPPLKKSMVILIFVAILFAQLIIVFITRKELLGCIPWFVMSAAIFAIQRIRIEKLYQKAISEDEIRVREEIARAEKIRGEIKNLKNERIGLNETLQNSYSLNIIPTQFRNIWAVYYLYDLLSSSNVSLRDALFHCDLGEIKVKMNVIIEQNRELLINQAIQMAQNDRIIEQNKKKLERLTEIEKNSALSAQYAKVAAANTEITAKIAGVSYLFPNKG